MSVDSPVRVLKSMHLFLVLVRFVYVRIYWFRRYHEHFIRFHPSNCNCMPLIQTFCLFYTFHCAFFSHHGRVLQFLFINFKTLIIQFMMFESARFQYNHLNLRRQQSVPKQPDLASSVFVDIYLCIPGILLLLLLL